MISVHWLHRTAASVLYRLARADVFRQVAFLYEVESWPAEQLNQWRLQRLNDILQFAWTHVPFYRRYWGDHGISQRRLQCLDEIECYPTITRATVKENASELVADNLRDIRWIPKSTGGSTGVPLQYPLDIEQWALVRAFQIWGMGLAGYRFGDALAVVAGGSLLPQSASISDRVRNIVERRYCALGVHMDAQTAAAIHNMMVKRRVRFVYGYPSILALFALECEKNGLQVEGLDAVITTAEILQPAYRSTIERVLKCPVFDDLGCGDGGFLSFECRLHRGYHYNALQSVLNVREPDADGMGPLVITNLWNRAMPFIRYENGDLIAMGSSRCDCGRGFPLIRQIRGRTGDILCFANGRSIAAPALTLIFGKMPIDAWQIAQTSPDAVDVRVLSKTDLSAEHVQYIERVLRHHLGQDVAIEIRRVQRLETTAAGKLKPVFKAF